MNFSEIRCVCFKHTFPFPLRSSPFTACMLFITTNSIHFIHICINWYGCCIIACRKMLQTQCLTYLNITDNANVRSFVCSKMKMAKEKHAENNIGNRYRYLYGLNQNGTKHDAWCTMHDVRYTVYFYIYGWIVECRTIFVFVHSRFYEHNSEKKKRLNN